MGKFFLVRYIFLMACMIVVVPWCMDAMEIVVHPEKDAAKVQALFELGELYTLGEDGKPDYEEAKECFEDVIKAGVYKGASAWSYLWLAKISLAEDCKDDAEEYLKKARSYSDEISFIGQLVTFLSNSHDTAIGKDIFLEGVQMGNARVIKFLLACGVDVNFSEYLHRASLMGYKDFDEFLNDYNSYEYLYRKKIIDRDELMQSVCFYEYYKLDYECIIDLLLENGADSEAQNEHGFTALHCASVTGLLSVVQLLLDKEAAIDAQTSDGSTALHYAARFGNRNVVELLLKKGADSDAKTSNDSTALTLAAVSGSKDVVELLLEWKAESNAKSNLGIAALHCAACFGSKDIVELLLKAGAAIDDQTNDGWTALHYAACFGYKDVVELLLERGAVIDLKGKEGYTALHFATTSGYKDIIELLIERGVDKEARNDYDQTALDLASEKGDKEIEEIFRRA